MIEFLSIKDVMGELKVCRGTVLKHIESGKLLSYRIGRLVRIARPDFDEFVKRGSSNCRRPVRRPN